MHSIAIILSPIMTDTRKLKYLLYAGEKWTELREKTAKTFQQKRRYF